MKVKRFSVLLFSVLLFGSAVSAAEDGYVLQKARERAERAGRAGAAEPDLPYTPLLVSFVPGLSVPVGFYDTSVSLGAIGALTGSVSGAQGAGVFNIALGKVLGVQGAGVFNIADAGVLGAQGAGVFNISGGSVSFAQGAGVFNIAEKVSGLQGAGVFNIAQEVSGAQGAGVFNIAGKADGLMAAGLFNVAGEVRGVMLGVVNVADRLDGVAIGLVNVIGNGVSDFSLDFQWETGTTYLGYRTGTKALFASFYGGAPARDFFETADRVTVGFGLGHRQALRPFFLDVELSAETPLSAVSWGELADCARGRRSARPEFPGFGSLRAVFGVGGVDGFGAYFGVKTDFQPTGSDRIPEHLLAGSAGSLELFGSTLEFRTKFLAGVQF